MTKVFLVHLRRPRSNADERRDDPFYEFGSFGCTGCHSSNLMNPRHAKMLEGARLGFIQGGPQGTRLVFLTPPVSVVRWKDRCEARWRPAAKPFKYDDAPVLASNDGRGRFPRMERFARAADRTTVEGGLSSRVRNLTRPLPDALGREVMRVYEAERARAPRSALARTYDKAMPRSPPSVDGNRRRTYLACIKELEAAVGRHAPACRPAKKKPRGSAGPC